MPVHNTAWPLWEWPQATTPRRERGPAARAPPVVDGGLQEREHVCLTVSFNHDLADGGARAPTPAPVEREARTTGRRATRGPHPGGGWGPGASVYQPVGASVPGSSGFAAADRRGFLGVVPVPVVPGVVGTAAVGEALLRRGVAGFETGAAVGSTSAFAAV